MSIAFEDQCCLGRKGAVVGHCGFDGHLGLWMVVLGRAGLMAGKQCTSHQLLNINEDAQR